MMRLLLGVGTARRSETYIRQLNGQQSQSIKRVTNLEMGTSSVQGIFEKFDKAIEDKLKLKTRGYRGDKPNPEDWADLMQDDEDFRDEFEKVYNCNEIPEADEPTPEVMDDTYLNMELALPRDDEGPEFARVTKSL